MSSAESFCRRGPSSPSLAYGTASNPLPLRRTSVKGLRSSRAPGSLRSFARSASVISSGQA